MAAVCRIAIPPGMRLSYSEGEDAMLRYFRPAFALMLLALGSSAFAADAPGVTQTAVSYTHLTLPTIYSV